MKIKLILLAMFLGVIGVGSAHAAAAVRGAKGYTKVNNSATAVLACKGPAAVYSVVLSTGATSDFAVLRDSNTANTSSAKTIEIPHSATLVTNVTFDPPLQFRNGVSFNVPQATNAALITCEAGVVNQ